MVETPLQPGEPSWEWAIYADATFAGLSTLIPVPFVDSAFEAFFRRRIAPTIAKRRGRALHPEASRLLEAQHGGWLGITSGCLLWPFRFAWDLTLRLSRKLLYFLTVKRTVDSLSRYWRRAYLLDQMVRRDHLTDHQRRLEQVDHAIRVLEWVLNAEGDGPLDTLARQIVFGPFRALGSLFRARHGREDPRLRRTEETMKRSWYRFDAYFRELGQRYERVLCGDPGSGARQGCFND